MKRCYKCKFFAIEDTGYSNHSVLATMVHCLKKQFEQVEESSSWKRDEENPESDDDFFKQAERCDNFVEETGTQIWVDVDNTIHNYKEDTQVYQAALEYDLWWHQP